MLHEFDREELAFMREHALADPVKLSLRYHDQVRLRKLITQIAARQKLTKKLPEWLANPQIQFPDGLALEQASSELTASLKASLISGDKLIDLTGGLGVDCYYLSQSFRESKYVERQADLAEFARYNYGQLQSGIQVVNAEAASSLAEAEADVVYLDPHRRGSRKEKQFRLEDHEPNVLELLNLLVKPGRKSLLKTSPMLDISLAISQLQFVAEVWVIAVGNECKEVVYLLEAKANGAPRTRTWNYSAGDWQYFESTATESPKPKISEPLSYLYEPNSAILKAGLQDQLAKELGISKLAPNSHLYTAHERLPDYPGRVYQVTGKYKPWDKSLKNQSFNVVSRNFPEKAPIIEKRLRLSPSDSSFLLATSLANKSKIFLTCDLIRATE